MASVFFSKLATGGLKVRDLMVKNRIKHERRDKKCRIKHERRDKIDLVVFA
jgi:hypothetical protein